MKKILALVLTCAMVTVATAAVKKPTSLKDSAPKTSYLTNLGKNYVSFIGQANLSQFHGDKEIFGMGTKIEGSYNLYQSKDNWGVDLVLPFEYNYLKTQGVEINAVDIPLLFRPYYAFTVSKNLVITPYAMAGCGVNYNWTYNMADNANDLNFLWEAGAGVEFSFCQDFFATPFYRYARIESDPFDYANYAGVQFGWRFTQKLTLLVNYEHLFPRADDIRTNEDKFGVGVRFEF